MNYLRLLGLTVAAVCVFTALLSVPAFALPTILPTTVTEFTGKQVGSEGFTWEKANGEKVECAKAVGEKGTIESNRHLGQFHVKFESCKAFGIAGCTGLGDSSGVILTGGSWHLVYDVLRSVLSEAGIAILFLLEAAHFTCTTELVTLAAGGMVLCLISNPAELTKIFEYRCNKRSGAKGAPEETKYYNEGGTLVAISALKAAKNEGTAEESVEAGLGTIESAEAASIMPASRQPAPPHVEQVNFTNPEPVLVDHTEAASLERLKRGEERPQTAKEVTSINEIERGTAAAEWQSVRGTMLKKNWPVAYPQATTMRIANTRLALEAETQNFLRTRLEGEVTLIGETTVGATAIRFEQRVTQVEVERQLEAGEHPSYLEFPAEVAASVALPREVKYSEISVRWKWRLKERGAPAAFEQPVGESRHNLYLTFARALESERRAKKIFFTLLARETELINNRIASQGEVVKAIWEMFSTGTEPANPPMWSYTLATGRFEKTRESMAYYQDVAVRRNLREVDAEEARAFANGKRTLAELLGNLDGECGAWQEALNKALKAEGIADKIAILTPSAAERFLVKNWNLVGVREVEIEKLEGVPGQATRAPSSFFINHQVVEVENKLYDPSYGLTPLAGRTEREGPLGGGAEAEEIQKKYQEQAMQGFCVLRGGEWNCTAPTARLELRFALETEVE